MGGGRVARKNRKDGKRKHLQTSATMRGGFDTFRDEKKVEKSASLENKKPALTRKRALGPQASLVGEWIVGRNGPFLVVRRAVYGGERNKWS